MYCGGVGSERHLYIAGHSSCVTGSGLARRCWAQEEHGEAPATPLCVELRHVGGETRVHESLLSVGHRRQSKLIQQM
jgi:hypothetical protein